MPLKTNAHYEQKRAIRESPLRESLKSIVGDDVLSVPPKPNDYRKATNQPVILSEVELFLSE